MTTTIQCAPFPLLTWDDDDGWRGTDHLAPWDGIDRCYGNGRPKPPRDRCEVEVLIRTAKDGRPPPNDEQRAAYATLRASRSLVDAILDALFEDYPEERRFLLENDRQDQVPPLRTADGIRDLVGLRRVYVLDDTTDGMAYLGLEFACSWEDEHGLGVVVLGERVVHVGHADVAFAWTPDGEPVDAITTTPTLPSFDRVEEPADQAPGQQRARVRARCARLADTHDLLAQWVGGGIELLVRLDDVTRRYGAALGARDLPEHAALVRATQAPSSRPRWTTMSSATATAASPRFAPTEDESADLSALKSYEAALSDSIGALLWLTQDAEYDVDRRLDQLVDTYDAFEKLGAQPDPDLVEEVDDVCGEASAWLARLRDPALRG